MDDESPLPIVIVDWRDRLPEEANKLLPTVVVEESEFFDPGYPIAREPGRSAGCLPCMMMGYILRMSYLVGSANAKCAEAYHNTFHQGSGDPSGGYSSAAA